MQEKSPSMLLGLLLVAAPAASAFGFAAVGCSAVRGVGGGVQLRNGGCVAAGRVRPVALGGLSMERKNFDKSYDGAFDDFRTSGSMPDIPGLGERYSLEASYVRARGGDVEAADGGPAGAGARAGTRARRVRGAEEGSPLRHVLPRGDALLRLQPLLPPHHHHQPHPWVAGQLDVRVPAGAQRGQHGLVHALERDRPGPAGAVRDPRWPHRHLLQEQGGPPDHPDSDRLLHTLQDRVARPGLRLGPAPAPLGAPRVQVLVAEADDEPYEIQIGQQLKGVASRAGFTDRVSDTKTQSSAPLGQRKILSAEEQYKALQQGTID
eukprot:CAMPEP_0180236320 /NCGR_PEP_ID=MMETSP0987-20121128/29709_1 /TAXON_ID=697907 /ORGANISM="non described non described, Strain CCMP2293" /LENGTH=320 /DNA_ID=CAMNT_0022202523 /DNA_START=197 /DNA_END=1160 /DNA_ORIENTATION=-